MIRWEVEAVEHELTRVNSRLRSIGWDAGPPRARVAEAELAAAE